MIHSNKSTEQRQIVTKVDELIAKGGTLWKSRSPQPPSPN
jgi:hypothetical protein